MDHNFYDPANFHSNMSDNDEVSVYSGYFTDEEEVEDEVLFHNNL
jgi:hypothetical protein